MISEGYCNSIQRFQVSHMDKVLLKKIHEPYCEGVLRVKKSFMKAFLAILILQ